ncbi:MAG: ABC transporter ATP-binding protein [Cellulomonas sp.]
MTVIVEVEALTKRFGALTAVDNASFTVREHTITGLLGRNGAGKTTLMQIITGQDFVTSGQIRLFGQPPLENAAVLSRTCFIKESQTYPDGFKGEHVLRVASWVFPHWDEALARDLLAEFRVPLGRRMKKMSRGQASAVGVVVGLASRAELTIFDEPYAGLDAVARQAFYDRLLADYAEHPRTVIMSTHLIDEVADLLEHVLVIHDGRMIIDASAEDLRGSATTISGKHAAVEAFARGREVLDTGTLGGFASVTVTGLSPADRGAATEAGLDVAPVSLQQLVIGRTRGTARQEVAS